MGCDIHSFLEVRSNKVWKIVKKDVLYYRDYSLFGWLANVRNYSYAPTISQPRGLPEDASTDIIIQKKAWGCDGHSHSWLSLSELLNFDYDQIFWDRRVTKEIEKNIWNGAATAEKGEGRHITLREHLSKHFFDALDIMKTFGKPEDVRLIFWFDN